MKSMKLERVTGELIAHHFAEQLHPAQGLRHSVSRESSVAGSLKIPHAEPHSVQNFRRHLILLPSGD